MKDLNIFLTSYFTMSDKDPYTSRFFGGFDENSLDKILAQGAYTQPPTYKRFLDKLM